MAAACASRDNSVRRPDQLQSYILSSTATGAPLLTLWSTSWCPTCRAVSPALRRLVEGGVGEAEGGVVLCEVEYDSPDLMSAGVGAAYSIASVPTLLAFGIRDGLPRVGSRLDDARRMSQKGVLEDWIRAEAEIARTTGGSVDRKGLFGGFWGPR